MIQTLLGLMLDSLIFFNQGKKSEQHSAKTKKQQQKKNPNKAKYGGKKSFNYANRGAQRSPSCSLPPLCDLSNKEQTYLIRRFEWIPLSTYSTTDTEPKARILLYPHTKLGVKNRETCQCGRK